MRRLFTTDDAPALGLTRAALRWGERTGRWRRVGHRIWADGPDDLTDFDRARVAVMASGGIASHHLAGVLHRLDSVHLDGTWVTLPSTSSGRRPRTCRRAVPIERVLRVADLACTDGVRTLLDLAASLTDVEWEQALESALRKGLTSVDAVTEAARGRGAAAQRARRVLDLRPAAAPPTESLLETLMVQLVRTVPGLPDPVRQLRIENVHGDFVARLDLAWPDLGLFVELDGQQHTGQPVYDARRETAVVAATGWLCGRFTWTELTRVPQSTARRLGSLAEQARRRPLPVQPRSSSATR